MDWRKYMKNSLSTRNLISSIVSTVLLLCFMAKSPSTKIIFVPFLICSLSMAGKSIARILNKKKMEFLFGKLFVLGFLLFFIGFLVVACFVSIRDKNYSLLVFLIPFWLIGIYLIKNRLFWKKGKKNAESVFTFAIIISTLFVVIALLAGIFLLVLGIKDADLGLILGGVIFTFGSFAFVLAALTIKGCFDKVKIDVLGLYAGIAIAVIGIGFILLKFRESYSLVEIVRSFGLWIIIPILMIAVGVYQVIKCIRNKK